MGKKGISITVDQDVYSFLKKDPTLNASAFINLLLIKHIEEENKDES